MKLYTSLENRLLKNTASSLSINIPKKLLQDVWFQKHCMSTFCNFVVANFNMSRQKIVLHICNKKYNIKDERPVEPNAKLEAAPLEPDVA